jgi:hypothetical protein
MNTRPAWGLLFLGAVIVAALLVSPLWLHELEPYIREEAVVLPFPDPFYALPNEAQDAYNTLYATERQKAIDLVAARLATAEALEEPYLPALDADPGAVQTLLTGTFVMIDPTRGATGTAAIYRLSDGSRVLRLENLEAINGPELHVLLTAYPDPLTTEDLEQVTRLQIDLGELKSSTGNQNYMITDPAFNPDNYVEGSVVLFSEPYQMIFSYASLSAPQ